MKSRTTFSGTIEYSGFTCGYASDAAKGALRNVLSVCSAVETGNGTIVDIASVQDTIQKHFEMFSKQGYRTLGVAYKNIASRSSIGKDDEMGMTFLGFLVLFDPPKPNIIEIIGQLKHLGVS